MQSLIDIGTAAELNLNVKPFTLADVRLYVSTHINDAATGDLYTVNPMQGTNAPLVGTTRISNNPAAVRPGRVEDILFRSDGRLFGYENVDTDTFPFDNDVADVAGRLVEYDPNTASQVATNSALPTNPINDGIRGPRRANNGNITVPNSYREDITYTDGVDALTMERLGFNNGAGRPNYSFYYSVRDPFGDGTDDFGFLTGDGVSKLFVDFATQPQNGAPDGVVQGITNNNQNSTTNNLAFRGYIGGSKDIPTAQFRRAVMGLFPNQVGELERPLTLQIIISPAGIPQNQRSAIIDVMQADTNNDGVIEDVIQATVRNNNGQSPTSTEDFADQINDNFFASQLAYVGVMNTFGGDRMDDVVFGGCGDPTEPTFGFIDSECLTTTGGNALAVQGITTGIAIHPDGTMYGVSDQGEFYLIEKSDASTPLVVDIPGSPSFQGLALGPQNLENGKFKDMFFASDVDGNLYAMNRFGELQTVFDNDGDFVAESTTTNFGLTGVTGLAFSPLDFNLWHPTTEREDDPGHGINQPFDFSRRPTSGPTTRSLRTMDETGSTVQTKARTENRGGYSLYFGFEDRSADNVAINARPYAIYSSDPDSNNVPFGILLDDTYQDLDSNPFFGGDYNLPGGAHGSLITNSFSLDGYDREEAPTLYFSYFLETEDDAAQLITDPGAFYDSARVFISADGGASWDLLATNNSALSDALPTDPDIGELAGFISHRADAGLRSLTPRNQYHQQVQELFDNTGGWRQARVDLSNYANLPDLRIRFDFATAGAINDNGLMNSDNQDFFGSRGTNVFGAPTNRLQAQNNSFEGFYVDDIIIGFNERGRNGYPSTGGPNDNHSPELPKSGSQPISRAAFRTLSA